MNTNNNIYTKKDRIYTNNPPHFFKTTPPPVSTCPVNQISTFVARGKERKEGQDLVHEKRYLPQITSTDMCFSLLISGCTYIITNICTGQKTKRSLHFIPLRAFLMLEYPEENSIVYSTDTCTYINIL